VLSACDVSGISCTGDLDALCARQGVHCVPSWSQAADASTWCNAADISNARAAVGPCLGNRVVVATANGTTVWYYYEPDGGLVGATRRNEQFQQECLAGRPSFRMPLDCASSDNPHCCRFDFGKEMACHAPPDSGTPADSGTPTDSGADAGTD
jgi:hypothetical protein